MARVYVASSWRNTRQPEVVARLLMAGHQVYDFRQPEPGDGGFHWSEIDPEWKSWDNKTYVQALNNPIADIGFEKDSTAVDECEACVLVMPSGRSAHLEAGFAKGAGKYLFILLDPEEPAEPELMYRWADLITDDLTELVECLSSVVIPNTFSYTPLEEN